MQVPTNILEIREPPGAFSLPTKQSFKVGTNANLTRLGVIAASKGTVTRATNHFINFLREWHIEGFLSSKHNRNILFPWNLPNLQN